jgi:hypothetical protein
MSESPASPHQADRRPDPIAKRGPTTSEGVSGIPTPEGLGDGAESDLFESRARTARPRHLVVRV